MAYVEDHARNLSPRRKAKGIERSVDRAVAEVAAHQRAEADRRGALIREAKAAVATMTDDYLAAIGAKHGLTSKQARANFLSLAMSHPSLVIKAVANTAAAQAA